MFESPKRFTNRFKNGFILEKVQMNNFDGLIST